MTATILTLDPEQPDPAALDKAAAIIKSGGLVVFPTETVYGLGANAEDPMAMEKLARVKNRPEGKPFAVHISDVEQVLLHSPQIPWRARMLANRYWPGPLTLVVPGTRSETIGLRMPAGAIPNGLIRRAGVPVAAPSANLSGNPAPTDATGAVRELSGHVDMIIDGGTTTLGQASSVVRLTGPRLELLREGILTREMLEATARVTILIACTGNTCRSPMAAALFRQRLSQRLGIPPGDLEEYGYSVISAGMGGAGAPASDGAITVMKERGIDLTDHRSRTLTRNLMMQADRIFGMTASHVRRGVELAPHRADETGLMAPDNTDVPDPAMGTEAEYRRCAGVLEDHVKVRVDQLLEDLGIAN